MLIDEVDIIVKGGHGGAGSVSFIGKHGGPDGGDGGKGGDVYVEATTDLYALNRFLAKSTLLADNGTSGKSNQRSGEDGKDLILVMPIGTFLIDESGNEIDLNKTENRILLVKGGLGGRGNAFFKSSKNTTPKYAQKGLPGEEKKLILKLKLIADFGLIGLPNAGKSSLLNEITSAQAKVGDYPFTTLEPNLGVLPLRHPERSEGSIILADIPGLIEGASEGKGLGHKFLKHIEKVKLLLHCISSESENSLEAYKVIHEELKAYNPMLLEKDEIILLTKSDLLETNEVKKKIKLLSKTKKKIIPLSIHNWESLQDLIKLLSNIN